MTEASKSGPDLTLDPVAATREFFDLATKANAAVQTALDRAAAGEPLPYDPTTIARAFSDFSLSLWANPMQVAEAQMKGWQAWTDLMRTQTARAAGEDIAPLYSPAKGDRRFSGKGWDEPAFDWLRQAYLLVSQQAHELIAGANLDEETRTRVDFFTRQALNALAPSNFVATNPDALKKTFETGGRNLITGLSHLLEDLAEGKGLPRRRAPDVFELGVNIAATPGSVVFQNELMQLIQYAPSTDEVFKRPLLFVPPLVNKYYLFDLTPKSSYLKWLVDQGHTVFVISWVNPTEAEAAKDMGDYVTGGVVAALDAIQKATGEPDVDLVSYCLGGTLSAIAMAYLAGKGEGARIASATLIAALVDFQQIGEWKTFLSEEDLTAFDKYLDSKGYVEAHDLAKLFSTVRANDLIWSTAVTHYLLGEESRASDLLWWFDDGARIPAAFLRDYGRLVLQSNRLTEANGVTIDGVGIDLKAIKTPVTLIAFKDDHVSAWDAVWSNQSYFGGPVTYLLGGSGHNAGMINPPAANKHGYWTGEAKAESADAWLAAAKKTDGSWWPEWQASLATEDKVSARKPGSGKLKVIEPAPGSYVRVQH